MAAESGVRRRRVFFVLDSLDEDDVGDHVATLLGRLSRARYEPRVVTLKGEGPLGPRIRDMRVTIHSLPGGGKLDPILVVPRLRKILTRLEADLVHASHHVSGAVAELAAPRGVPVVRFVPRLRSKADPLVTRLAAAMESLAARHRNVRFVVGSDDARAAVAAHYGTDAVDVIPECIDVPAIRSRSETIDEAGARSRLGLMEGETAVVFVTGFPDEPHVEAVLGGFSMARLEHPGLRLFLLGTGPAETHARGRAEDLHMSDSVVFLRDDAMFEDLLVAAEAVVDAALWPGPSRPALKGAAAGMPVLRWKDGQGSGDPQSIPPSIASSPERFAVELVRTVVDARLNQQLRDGSAALAKESDVAVVAEQWADLYDDVVDGAMREG